MSNKIENGVFVLLAENDLSIPEDDVLTKGKDIAGLSVIKDGVDMLGRKFAVKAKEIKNKYLPNTIKRIKMMQDKGEPGLPIDDEKHSFGKAAGWITGASLGSVTDSGGKKRTALMLAVAWTKLGVELIKNKIMTNFSPVFNTESFEILGGSLTNYPANKDEKGIPLFDAIMLSEEISYLTEDSLNEQARKVKDAFRDALRPVPSPAEVSDDQGIPWVAYDGVFDDYVIVKWKGKDYKVAYSTDDDGVITFDPFEKWKVVKLEKTWVEAAQEIPEKFTQWIQEIISGSTLDDEEEVNVSNLLSEGGHDMAKKMTLEGLSDEERAQVMAQAQSAVMAEFGLDGEGADVTAAVERIREKLSSEIFGDLVGLDGVRDTLTQQVEGALKLELENMENQMGIMLAQMTAEYRRKQEVSQFATKVCQGDDGNAHGLPVVQQELEAILLSIDDEAREGVCNILQAVWTRGPISFKSKGLDGEDYVPGEKALDPKVSAILVQAQEAGVSIEDFFDTNELGDPAEFDLSEFVVTEKEE